VLGALIVFARSNVGAVHRLDVSFDDNLNAYVAGHPAQVSAWKLVSDIGGPLTWRILAGGAAVVLFLRRLRREAVLVVAAMVGAWVSSGAIKALVDRHRPSVPTPVDHVGGGSFPSGHALTSFTALGLLVLLTWPIASRWWRVLVVSVSALVVLAIGFSRLILGVHYLTDVLGGWLIGLLLLIAATLAVRARR
jgi:membrane-associated phospholipid phosphatase